MLTVEESDANGIVIVRASGTLNVEDFRNFVPSFEAISKRRGPLRIYLALDDLQNIEPSALWEDVKFDAAHQDSYQRIAVVGDRAWQDWGTRLSKPFFQAQMRFFSPEEQNDAVAWLLDAPGD